MVVIYYSFIIPMKQPASIELTFMLLCLIRTTNNQFNVFLFENTFKMRMCDVVFFPVKSVQRLKNLLLCSQFVMMRIFYALLVLFFFHLTFYRSSKIQAREINSTFMITTAILSKVNYRNYFKMRGITHYDFNEIQTSCLVK